MEANRKRRLKAKFIRYPFFRLLIYDFWFRVAILGFVGALLVLPLIVVRIWTSSPRRFHPVIKVSGLDLAQAWSLKRTALKAMAAGQFEDAKYAWMAALANNRGSVELVRGSLQNFLNTPGQEALDDAAFAQCVWLLRLTGTNAAALELVSDVFEKHNRFDLIVQCLESHETQFNARLQASYLKALFHQGQFDQFDRWWPRAAGHLPSNNNVFLYRKAHLAGWGPLEMRSKNLKELQAAADTSSRQRLLACQLSMVVAVRQLDHSACAKWLQELEACHAGSPRDHINYWRVLQRTGKKPEAIALIRAWTRPPKSSVEAIELAQAHVELGLRDEALGFLAATRPRFADAPAFWVFWAEQLITAKRWDELRRISYQIRGQHRLHEALAAYSYYLEAHAEISLNRNHTAALALDKLRSWEFAHPVLALMTASNLLQIGRPASAREVLLKMERHGNGNPGYWQLVFRTAHALKDDTLMLAAARRQFELNPRDAVAANNFAAALLIRREQPDEAVKLTLALASENPHSLIAAANYGAALLRIGRLREAEQRLCHLPTNGLNHGQLAVYRLNLFELNLKLQRFETARELREALDVSSLFPPQQRWLEESRHVLAAGRGG